MVLWKDSMVAHNLFFTYQMARQQALNGFTCVHERLGCPAALWVRQPTVQRSAQQCSRDLKHQLISGQKVTKVAGQSQTALYTRGRCTRALEHTVSLYTVYFTSGTRILRKAEPRSNNDQASKQTDRLRAGQF